MKTIFCMSCGKKLEYSYSMPKFCSNCGFSMSGLTLTKKSKPTNHKSDDLEDDEDDEDLEDDETNATELPDISKILVDTNLENGNKTMTFGSLFGESDKPIYKRSKRSKSIDDFIDEKRV